jgi:hypothetical protein
MRGSNPICCECCVLPGRGLCDELIIRTEEHYRLWCFVVCDLETSWMRRPWHTGRSVAPKINKKTKISLYSVTQSQLLANKMLCVVLSSTGINYVDTFCIWVIHKVIKVIKRFSTLYLLKISVFGTGYIISELQLTTLVLWLNNHDPKKYKIVYII